MIKFHRKFDPHKIKLLIFDLDGTLIDSRLDLIHSVNAMLKHFGRPALPGDVIASYVGDGAPTLVRRALGDPRNESVIKEGLEHFLGYYRIHKLDHTHVYDGIKEMLPRDSQHQRYPPQDGRTLQQTRNSLARDYGSPRPRRILSPHLRWK